MKTTSQEFKNLAENPNGARYYIKISDSGTEIKDDIDDFVYSGSVSDDTSISIGTVCSSSVTFSITNPTVNLAGKELEILQGIDVGENIEYVKIGIFKVLKLTKNRNVTLYECVDRMTARMEMPYFSDLSFPNTDIAILQEICSQAGIALKNANELKAHTIKFAPKGYTKREAISYMAALQGKNAIINGEGNLELIWYSQTDYTVDDDKIYYDGTSNINDETDYTLGYIECTVSNEEGTEQNTLKSGSGNTGIKIENPFMTQEILNEVFTSIGNFFYRAAEFEFLGDFRLEAGDIVTVKTGSSTYKVPIMQLTQKSDGGVVTTIQAVAESKSENDINLTGPITKQMERYYADIVLINQAMINKLSADEADIRYLKTDQLDTIEANITSAVIGNLETEFITADYADLNYAKIDLTNIEKATIGTVLADVGLITNATIVDGHVTGYLDSVNINANSITAGDLSVERLIIRGSDRSLVYALNNITGALQAKNVDTLNGEVLTKRTVTADRLVAKSITANEIAAGTINANNLNVANIFADSTVLNTLTAQSAFINAISTNSVVVGAGNTANSALNAINNLQIGAKNILRYSGQFTNTTNGYWIDNGGGITFDASEKYNGYNTIKTTVGSGIAGQWHKLDNNTEYTYSVMLKSNAAFTGTKSTPIHYWAGKDNVNQGKISIIKYDTVYPTANKWKLLYITFKLTGDANSFRPFVYTSAFKNVFHIAYLKLEKGNRATDWSPAPEDISVENIYKENTTLIDGGKIYTGTVTANAIASKAITANKINVASLSAISANLGTITAGIIRSANYVANSKGMQLNLANGVWDSKNFKISSSGEVSIVGMLETKEGSTDKAVVDQNGLSIYGSTGFLGRFNEINLSDGREGLLIGAQPAAKAIWFGTSTAAEPNSYSPKMVINNGYNPNGFTEEVIVYNTLRAVKSASIGGATSSYALTTSSFLCNSWIRTKGNTGWFNETYGGGINMTDSTWIRTYGNKQFYCDKLIQSPQIKATVQADVASLICRGGAELYHATPHIDFHFGNSSADYTSRIIEYSSGKLTVHNSIVNASDARLKKDIQDLSPVYVDILDNLKPKQYRFIKGDKYLNLGFVAQEVEETLKKFGITDMPLISKENGTYALDYNGIIAMLVLGYQSLKKDLKKF